MKKIKNVLFICLGNTARSPAAEYIAKARKQRYKDELKDVIFDSAGFINAFSYMQAESREYVKSKGVDPSDFVPKIINRRIFEDNDLILTMERSHKRDIVANFNNVQNIERKTFTLKEFAGETRYLDIADPYYMNPKEYNQILKIIDENVEKSIKKIIELNQSSD